jgi:hypothetical protein
MGNIIVDPSEGRSPIQPAFDPYWDKPMTRREAHRLFMKLAANDNELTGMADTAAILLNFICEKKLGITDRTEVDAYVLVKTEQLKAQRAALKAAADRGETVTPPNEEPQPTATQSGNSAQAGVTLTDAQSNS